MWAIKRLLVIALCVALCAPVAPAQDRQRDAHGAQDVTIIIQQQQVRFIARKAGEEMRLQVFDQSGELVFDSGAVEATEVNWPLQAITGETLKSGLYAYTLSIKEIGKEAGAAEARLRRGHFIVDRAKDRDGADKLWVTSQNESGVGAELIVAKDEAATVAGAAISNGGNERTMGRQAEITGRDEASRTVETETQSQSKPEKGASKEASSAVAASTVGRIAKFITATAVGDSVITELNGNIGIGTTNPTSNLEVNGTLDLKTGGSGGELYFHTPAAETGLSILGASRADIRFDGTTLKLVAGPISGPPPAERGIAINTSGNVGIGTNNPESKLDVFGTTLLRPGGTGGVIQFGNPASETGMSIVGSNRADIRFDGTTLKLVAGPVGGPPPAERGMVINTAGNVGVGTNAPAAKLHVIGGVRLENAGKVLSFQTGSEIDLTSNTSSIVLHSLGPNGQNHIVLNPNNGNGNVGIGTFTPQAKLDVVGRTRTGSLEIVGGADFAENFDIYASPSNQTAGPRVAPGMVVTIDPARQGKLALSQRAYDRRVAGIISGAGGVKPGMTMGQEQTLADGKYPVALSGRVYVWADATHGAIRPGDLLTTARTPGHAMKVANPAKAQGAIIGKAMTGLKSGRGLILVLVTLQ